MKEAGRQAGREAARHAFSEGGRISEAKAAWRDAAARFKGLRFHDLRHQAITELAEAGAADSVIQSLAGHLSKKMLDHYSHVRMAAKREAVDALADGLMTEPSDREKTVTSQITSQSRKQRSSRPATD